MKELAHIAIDPLDQVFTWQTFQYLLAEKAAKMKQLLMDQKFISGLGNIYSDEVLFHAGLRYDRMSDTLSSQEVRRLYRAIQEILQESIKARGTTLDDEAYVDLFGKPGEYAAELKVYGRAGLPCRRCRTPIQSVKISRAPRVLLPAVPELSAAARDRGQRRTRGGDREGVGAQRARTRRCCSPWARRQRDRGAMLQSAGRLRVHWSLQHRDRRDGTPGWRWAASPASRSLRMTRDALVAHAPRARRRDFRIQKVTIPPRA